MNWNELTEAAQLDEIDIRSKETPVLIFKHSTRCNISATALSRLERAWTAADDQAHTLWFLDLLKHRPLSDAIAQRYGIEHESPQALVIKDGKCVDVSAHFGIAYKDLIAALAA